MDPLALIQPHLRDDENLLWSGAPDPQVRFTSADLFLVPFSVLWCGFAIIWEVTSVAGGAPAFFNLWGIPFILVGLYMTVGRFYYKRYRKSRTAYAVTTRRAIIAGPRSFTDMPLAGRAVNIQRSRDGRHASVVIGEVAPQGWNRRRSSAQWYPNTGMELLARNVDFPFAFYDVADPDAMLQALDRGRSQTTT